MKTINFISSILGFSNNQEKPVYSPFIWVPFLEQLRQAYSSELVLSGIENFNFPQLPQPQKIMLLDNICQGTPKAEKFTYSNPNRFGLGYATTSVIADYMWGIKVGEKVIYDLDDYSLLGATRRALLLPNAEVVCDTRIVYLRDGSRQVEAIRAKSLYDTSTLLTDWFPIDLDKARNLFPQCNEEFDQLEKNSERLIFLVSPDFQHLRLVSELYDSEPRNFYEFCQALEKKSEMKCFIGQLHITSNLRQTFEWIAEKVRQGDAYELKNNPALHEVKIGGKTYRFRVGFPYLSYQEALKIAKDQIVLKKAYVTDNSENKKLFNFWFDGELIVDSAQNSQTTYLLPAEIYEQWGKPFTSDELKEITRERKWSYYAPSEYRHKVNYLRFTKAEVCKAENAYRSMGLSVPARGGLTGKYIMCEKNN